MDETQYHPSTHPSICASVTVVFNGYKPRFEIWSCFFFINNFLCVRNFEVSSCFCCLCIFFAAYKNPFFSTFIHRTCCVSSCVLLCFPCQFPPISSSLFSSSSSVPCCCIGFLPGAVVTLAFVALHWFSDYEDLKKKFKPFAAAPARVYPEASRVSGCGGVSGRASFYGESEVYRRHPFSSSAAAGCFPHQRRYRKTFLSLFVFGRDLLTVNQAFSEREGESFDHGWMVLTMGFPFSVCSRSVWW